MKKEVFRLAAGAALVLTLGACGGGGGGGTSGSPGSSSSGSASDLDGDGLSNDFEVTRSGTSPRLADTDGDGYSDFEEVNNRSFDPTVNPFRFNPLVADIPKFEITLSERPKLSVFCTEGTSQTREFSTSETTESSNSITNSTSGSESQSLEFGVTLGSSVGASAKDGLGGSLSYEVSASETNTTTVGWSEENTTTNTNAFSRSQSYASTNSETCTRGLVQTTATLTNTGHIAFTVENLTLNAERHDSADPQRLLPVGNLVFDSAGSQLGAFPKTTLSQNQALQLTYQNSQLSLSEIRAIMLNSRSLNIEAVPPQLTDVNDNAFAHNQTQIGDRTVMVIIDYGGENNREPERYQVAANPDPDNPGVTATQALREHMRMTEGANGTYQTGTLAWDFDGDQATDADTFPGLLRMREVAANATTYSYWVAAHTRSNGVDTTTTYLSPLKDGGYDLDTIDLKAGDTFHLALIKDPDQDGLGTRTEFMYGTDPENADTDGDGLSDGFEINGWVIDLNGSPVQVYTDPTLADTDGDGQSDAVEEANGTHPSNRGEPAVTEVITSTDSSTVTLTARVNDPDGQVIRLTIDWGDGSPDTVIEDSNIVERTVAHTYAQNGRYRATVTAEDDGGLSSVAARSSALNIPDALLVFYEFSNDLLDSGPLASDAQGFLHRFGPDRFGEIGTAGLFTNNDASPSNTMDVKYNLIKGPHLGFTESFTLSAWVLDFNPGEAPRYIGQGNWFSLYQQDDRMHFGQLNESVPTGPRVSDPDPMPSSRWTFWVGIAEYDGLDTVLSLYRNGELVRQTTVLDIRFDNPGSCNFYVGPGSVALEASTTKRFPDDPSDCSIDWARTSMPGDIDDVRVYNRALSQDEVRDLYLEKGWPGACVPQSSSTAPCPETDPPAGF